MEHSVSLQRVKIAATQLSNLIFVLENKIRRELIIVRLHGNGTEKWMLTITLPIAAADVTYISL